jgi:hypothetical protein
MPLFPQKDSHRMVGIFSKGSVNEQIGFHTTGCRRPNGVVSPARGTPPLRQMGSGLERLL